MHPVRSEGGFTLIELMVSLVIGMVLLAGMALVFVNETRTTSSEVAQTQASSDLFLLSQIMISELRSAQSITLDGTGKILTYQNIDKCADGTTATGVFQYQRTANDRIYWLRPCEVNYQELARGLNTSSGMVVTSSGGMWNVALTATYTDQSRQTRNASMEFKAWPRNQ